MLSICHMNEGQGPKLIQEDIRFENQDLLQRLESSIEQDLKSDIPHPIFIIVAGLPAAGKTEFIRQWVASLEAKYKSQFPICLYDLRKIIQHADKKDNSQSFVVGGMSVQQYREVAILEDEFRQTVLRGLGCPSIFIYEAPVFTESFDEHGRTTGVPRGGLDGIKNLSQQTSLYFVALITDDEERRRRGVKRKDELYVKDDIWQKVEKQYDHAIISIFDGLLTGGVRLDPKLLELNSLLDRNNIRERSRLVEAIVELEIIPRIGRNIFGREVNNRLFVLRNHTNPRLDVDIDMEDKDVVKFLLDRTESDPNLKNLLSELRLN